MKLTTSAFALVLAGTAMPAAAQYGGSASTQSMPPPNAAQSQPTESAKPGPKPSPQALKAMIELQDAVKAGDPATIAAKAAAAQKVAKTKEDRFLIAQFQLQAAVKAKDNVAALTAMDAISAAGGLDAPTLAKDYTIVGAALSNEKKFDLAASAFDKALA